MRLNLDLAGRAAILYLTNISAIVFSACVVFLLSGVKPRVSDLRLHGRVSAGLALAAALGAVLTVELIAQTAKTIGWMRDSGEVLDVIREWSGRDDIDVEDIMVTGDEVYIDLVTLEGIVESLPPSMRIRNLDAQLDQRLERDVETTVRSRLRLLSTTCSAEDRCYY